MTTFLSKVLEEKQSRFNGKIRVVKTLGMGTYIQADGLTQSGGIVKTIWKQTLKQIPDYKFQITNCLILGLGGGTVAKLVRKKYPEAEIIGIDIDPLMINLGKKYLGLDKANIKIQIADALKYVEKLVKDKKKFDLIIIDLYNGDHFPKKFETENYIQLMRTVLASGGLAVFNRIYYGDKRPLAVRFGNKLEKIFPKVDWFYPEANLMFICSKL